jgi:hypothetical protein
LRISIIIALLLSFIFLLRSGITAWRYSPLPPPLKIEDVQESSFQGKANIKFFHSVPVQLPDLHKGYIFNVERELVEEELTELETKTDKDIGDEIDIDFDGVSYSGSIITGDRHKAIVSYTIAPPRRTVRSRSSRLPPRSRQAASKNKYAQLEAGDTFYGYKVVGIYPEKIVFERDDEKIEKLLHDPAKKRLRPPPILSTKSNATTTRQRTTATQAGAQNVPPQKTAPQTKDAAKTPPRQPAVPERRSTVTSRSRRRSVPPAAQPLPAKE